jgi:hypothetical protein
MTKKRFCSICGKENWKMTIPGEFVFTDLQICPECWPKHKDITVVQYFALTKRLNGRLS